jgi:hypothetical protein
VGWSRRSHSTLLPSRAWLAGLDPSAGFGRVQRPALAAPSPPAPPLRVSPLPVQPRSRGESAVSPAASAAARLAARERRRRRTARVRGRMGRWDTRCSQRATPMPVTLAAHSDGDPGQWWSSAGYRLINGRAPTSGRQPGDSMQKPHPALQLARSSGLPSVRHKRLEAAPVRHPGDPRGHPRTACCGGSRCDAAAETGRQSTSSSTRQRNGRGGLEPAFALGRVVGGWEHERLSVCGTRRGIGGGARAPAGPVSRRVDDVPGASGEPDRAHARARPDAEGDFSDTLNADGVANAARRRRVAAVERCSEAAGYRRPAAPAGGGLAQARTSPIDGVRADRADGTRRAQADRAGNLRYADHPYARGRIRIAAGTRSALCHPPRSAPGE